MFKSVLMAVLAFGFSLGAAAAPTNPDDCVYINKVRAFAPESDTTLVVRQGKGVYRRIELVAGCPVVQADRIGFGYGNTLMSVHNPTGGYTRVTSSNMVGRFCSATPHANVVLINDRSNHDRQCKILTISPATEEEFDALRAKDNRY